MHHALVGRLAYLSSARQLLSGQLLGGALCRGRQVGIVVLETQPQVQKHQLRIQSARLRDSWSAGCHPSAQHFATCATPTRITQWQSKRSSSIPAMSCLWGWLHLRRRLLLLLQLLLRLCIHLHVCAGRERSKQG